jgi:pyruvate,water dikinase
LELIETLIVAFDYDERDEAVKEMVKMAIEGAKRNNKYNGLCGQAPSDYPEFAKFLVSIGIESMSLNPDSVLKVIQDIVNMEKDK